MERSFDVQNNQPIQTSSGSNLRPEKGKRSIWRELEYSFNVWSFSGQADVHLHVQSRLASMMVDTIWDSAHQFSGAIG